MIVFDWQDDGQDDGEENPIQHLGVEMVAYLKTLQCIDIIRNFLNRGTCTCVLISFLSRSNKKAFQNIYMYMFLPKSTKMFFAKNSVFQSKSDQYDLNETEIFFLENFSLFQDVLVPYYN